MSIDDAIVKFAAAARRDRAANPGTVGDGTALELLLAPRFHALLEMVLPEVAAIAPNVLPEFRRPGVGRPDLALVRPGEPARAFIELKQPGLALDPARFTGHNAEQFARFCELPLWALCNFTSIQLYRRDALEAQAEILPAAALEPRMSVARAGRLIRSCDVSGFAAVLRTLAMAAPVAPRDAEEVAAVLAHAARLVRSVVAAQCGEGLGEVVSQVRADFNETLFARAEAGGYDPADTDAGFSSAFAQTLVFGLLLAREASGRDVDERAYDLLPDSSWPLLRGTLRALTLDEVRAMLGVAFDVTVDAVNAVDPVLLAPVNGRDPVLYLYENFLRIFDPEAVKRYGVYYTPPEIVRLIVAEVDRTLRGSFGSAGLLDEAVQLLDPACGTGTFLIAAAGEAAHRAEERFGEGAVAAEVEAFAQRMHGFELLVGPYAVAHYRMTREVAGRGAAAAARLPIFLTDTLAPPADAAGVQAHLAFLSAPIVAERQQADAVKRDAPILVVLGNPPYKRLRAGEVRDLIGADMETRWEDLKQPVRDAGHGLSLNAFPDLYIAFYRWALWRLFEVEEAQGRGVLAFITNRNFLTGRGFGGLRKMLRERFERIRIIDFRGDNRTARPALVELDQNVFSIKTGVCILVAEANNNALGEARVEYADVWREGAFTRSDKLNLANTAATDPQRFAYRLIEGAGMDRLTPAGFVGRDWPALDRIFNFRSNGIVTYRDQFVYATEADSLERRILNWHNKNLSEARKEFKDSAANKVGFALAVPFNRESFRRVSYRPLDVRHLYNHPNFVDRPRQALQEVWGVNNVGLFALGDGTGGGPAVWCHGLIPDQHAFNGRGGWVFPLWDHRNGQEVALVNEEFLTDLEGEMGASVGPQEVFDCTLALLSDSSYSTRFAWDLEDAFPHIPFPAESDLFRRMAVTGASIRALQTYAADPDERFFRGRIQGRAIGPILDIPPPRRAFTRQGDEGTLALTMSGDMCVAGVSARVWEFALGNYPVLDRWLRARRGQALDATMHRSILELVARIGQLLYLFDEADALLEEALEVPLSFGPRWKQSSGAADNEGEDAEPAA